MLTAGFVFSAGGKLLMKKLLIAIFALSLLAAACDNGKQTTSTQAGTSLPGPNSSQSATTERTTSDQPEPTPPTQTAQQENTRIIYIQPEVKAEKNMNSEATKQTPTPPVIMPPSASLAVEISGGIVCEKTKSEFSDFSTKYKYVSLLGVNIIKDFKNLPSQTNTGSFESDVTLAYQRNLAQKDAFINSLNQFDSEVQKISLISFGQDQIIALKQGYSQGSTYYRNAFDLKVAALKMAMDNPNSISALDNAMTMNSDYIKKAASGANLLSSHDAWEYSQLTEIKNKILSDNKCL